MWKSCLRLSIDEELQEKRKPITVGNIRKNNSNCAIENNTYSNSRSTVEEPRWLQRAVSKHIRRIRLWISFFRLSFFFLSAVCHMPGRTRHAARESPDQLIAKLQIHGALSRSISRIRFPWLVWTFFYSWMALFFSNQEGQPRREPAASSQKERVILDKMRILC